MSTIGQKISLNLLIIDDEADMREVIRMTLEDFGCRVTEAGSAVEAAQVLEKSKFDVVVSDVHMPEKSGLTFFAECKERMAKLPSWIFLTGDYSAEVVEKASRIGAADVVGKPIDNEQLFACLKRIADRGENKSLEISDMIQAITGVKLGKEKTLLVETRLMRRVRALKLNSVDEYLEYFRSHRESEIPELVSAITTHTTSFFREPGHFDFLIEEVFPKLIKPGASLRIWSAACSTGEEVYSLAISLLEFMRMKGIAPKDYPKIEIIGTDIDFNSVSAAQEGVYRATDVEKISKEILSRYFDFGTGEFSQYVRLKDNVHRLCSFKQMNLQAHDYSVHDADVIMIRNVLIYFDLKQVKEIVSKLSQSLKKEGYIFLGHSESLRGMDLPLEVIGNSVYAKGLKKRVVPLKLVGEQPAADKAAPIRLLIVDDSLSTRKVLAKIVQAHGEFVVVAEAANPLEAQKILGTTQIDLMTLDIHMPEMDGVTYLQQLQGKPHPPIVMISSISYDDAVSVLNCFEYGALDYIEKPDGQNLESEGQRIRSTLKMAYKANSRSFTKKRSGTGKLEAVDSFASFTFSNIELSRNLIVIGASTGGTEAIKDVISDFPEKSPPVLIVQHIPPSFSRAFAQRLNEICHMEVKEAENGDVVRPGHVYIAPGGKQMRVADVKGSIVIEITDDEAVNRHKPSVDYLFNSVAPLAHAWNVSAALLTGMGADGAKGLLALGLSGAHTIAQDEDTCVVFGMPREAIELGAAKEVLPLPSIGYHLFKAFRAKKAA